MLRCSFIICTKKDFVWIIRVVKINTNVKCCRLSTIAIQFLTKNLNNKIINICDQNKISSYEAVKYVADELELNEPLIIKYNSNKVSESLKSFYEFNRIIKCKVIENELKYKYKYPDYAKALLTLTKKIIKK